MDLQESLRSELFEFWYQSSSDVVLRALLFAYQTLRGRPTRADYSFLRDRREAPAYLQEAFKRICDTEPRPEGRTPIALLRVSRDVCLEPKCIAIYDKFGALSSLVHAAQCVSVIHECSLEKGIEVSLAWTAPMRAAPDKLTQKCTKHVLMMNNVLCSPSAIRKKFEELDWREVRSELKSKFARQIQRELLAKDRGRASRFLTNDADCQRAITKAAIKLVQLNRDIGPDFDGAAGYITWSKGHRPSFLVTTNHLQRRGAYELAAKLDAESQTR